MIIISRTLIALLATAAVGGVGASAARASSVGDFSTTGPCATGPAGPSVAFGGDTGGTTATVCSGAGLTFVGPAIGQIASVIGPTIIGSTVVGGVVVSAGDGSAG